MNTYSVAILLFAFGSVFVAILGWLKRKDRIARKFLWFSISISAWGIPAAYWVSLNYSLEQTEFLMRIAHVFAVYVPITWAQFVLSFIEKKDPVKGFSPISYGIAIVLMTFCFSDIFIQEPRSVGAWKYAIHPGPVYHLFTLYFFTLVFYCFYSLITAFSKAEGDTRNQIGCFVIATGFGFMGGTASFTLAYGYDTAMLAMIWLMPLYPLFMGIGFIRYGLFDVQKIADAFQREKLAAIGTMAASLNHELRNPLYVAKTKIEAYRDAVERKAFLTVEEDHARSRETLDTAWGQLDRAMDIMQRFSDFARPYAQKGNFENVEIRRVVGEVLDLVSSEVELKKIQVDTSMLNGECIKANRRQTEEIFFNLILNACHALSASKPASPMKETKVGAVKNGSAEDYRITISSRRQNNIVQIVIADNGPGIPSEQLKQIFEPFYTTKEEGTGLGLYITKQLVEKNGGKIAVQSSLGQGTRFVLNFSR